MVAQRRDRAAACPLCQQPSPRIHSQYVRRLADLPWPSGRVELHVRVRRFRCFTPGCRRRIFAERLPEVAAVRARGTLRLRTTQRQIGLALGGEPGARLACHLAMPVSADTLLRLIRSAPLPLITGPRVLGLDEWAWRRGHRYGTILCDLERHRIMDLLPDRQADTVAAWLNTHPRVEIVARDRTGAYAEGIRLGAPNALQVADRWYLLCNLSEAVQGIFDRARHALQQAARDTRAALSALTPVPDLPPRRPTRGEQRKADKQAARQARYEEVAHRRAAGQPIRQIAREFGLGHKTVRRWWRAGQAPTWQPPPRSSGLDPYRGYLQRRWQGGCRNAAQLWRELRDQGFAGCPALVRRWAGQRRQGESSTSPTATGAVAVAWKTPSSRRAVRLVLAEADHLADTDGRFVSTLLAQSPELARVVALARRFTGMVQQREPNQLEAWLTDAKATGLATFAQSLSHDLAAVRAALTLPWSTSPVEGHINAA